MYNFNHFYCYTKLYNFNWYTKYHFQLFGGYIFQFLQQFTAMRNQGGINFKYGRSIIRLPLFNCHTFYTISREIIRSKIELGLVLFLGNLLQTFSYTIAALIYLHHKYRFILIFLIKYRATFYQFTHRKQDPNKFFY